MVVVVVVVVSAAVQFLEGPAWSKFDLSEMKSPSFYNDCRGPVW